MRDINLIVVHCSDSPWADAEAIRNWHQAKGWDDVGYHAVILNGFRRNSRDYAATDDGLIEPGRDLYLSGAHVRGHNKHSIGVCLVGEEEFTSNQFGSLKRLLWVWRQMYQVPDDRIMGHRELDSGKTCPNFDVQEWVKGAFA